jgi:surface polysaccharide O-acyltransferase-like enzyme
VVNESWNQAQLTAAQHLTLVTTIDVAYSFVGIGVPLFFMISGALLLQPSKLDEPIGLFLKKRVARVGVAFLFWSVIYFLWAYYVQGTPLTFYTVTQELLQGGAYYQFWFIYAIMGIYLLTPLLRMMVKNAKRDILRYLIVLWIIATFVPPLVHLATGLAIDDTLLVLSGYIGYFVLGVYLMNVKVKTKTLVALLAIGVSLTFLGLLLMQGPFNYLGQYYFFDGYKSFTVLLSSVAAFLLLCKVRSDWPGPAKPWLGGFMHTVGENTLPIFFMHVIIVQLLNFGTFGLQISLTSMSPFIEIPLATALTLLICLTVIVPVKKVPALAKLIG